MGMETNRCLFHLTHQADPLIGALKVMAISATPTTTALMAATPPSL